MQLIYPLYQAEAVAITGGTIDGVPIGGTTPAAGAFTTLNGKYTILTDTDIASNNITAAQASMGSIIFNDSSGNVDYNLPPAAAGLSIRVKAVSAHKITLDPDGSDVINLIDGTALTAGNAVDSDSSNGAYLWLVAYDAVDWWVMGQVGAWSDGGAD